MHEFKCQSSMDELISAFRSPPTTPTKRLVPNIVREDIFHVCSPIDEVDLSHAQIDWTPNLVAESVVEQDTSMEKLARVIRDKKINGNLVQEISYEYLKDTMVESTPKELLHFLKAIRKLKDLIARQGKWTTSSSLEELMATCESPKSTPMKFETNSRFQDGKNHQTMARYTWSPDQVAKHVLENDETLENFARVIRDERIDASLLPEISYAYLRDTAAASSSENAIRILQIIHEMKHII